MAIGEIVTMGVVVGYGIGLPIALPALTGEQDTMIAGMLISLVVTPMLVIFGRVVDKIGKNTEALTALTQTLRETAATTERTVTALADRNAAKLDTILDRLPPKRGWLTRLFRGR